MYTYDVYWEESDIAWSSRWDAYLRMPGGRVRVSPLAYFLHICIHRDPGCFTHIPSIKAAYGRRQSYGRTTLSCR